MQNEETNEMYAFAKSMLSTSSSIETIELRLKEKSNDDQLILDVIHQIKKDRNNAKNSSGIKKLFLGAFLLVSSFIIACVNYHSNLPFELVLYSFTTVALVLLVWALYDLLH